MPDPTGPDQVEAPPDRWITRGNAVVLWVLGVLGFCGFGYLAATNTDLQTIPPMVYAFSILVTAVISSIVTQATIRGRMKAADELAAQQVEQTKLVEFIPDGKAVDLIKDQAVQNFKRV